MIRCLETVVKHGDLPWVCKKNTNLDFSSIRSFKENDSPNPFTESWGSSFPMSIPSLPVVARWSSAAMSGFLLGERGKLKEMKNLFCPQMELEYIIYIVCTYYLH